ncbi:MAG TPA: c-type cytochrome [Caulobacteraceae bacterium]|nr:c-type cytochrome [Caulobacteraceae bacterium]
MRRSSVLAFLAAAALVTVPAATVAQPAGDPTKGAQVFEDNCSGCHVLEGVGQGPSLIGVVGRRAGALPGFPYTDAIKAAGLTWTRANIDRFLTGPGKLVPGTAMQIVVPSEADRRNVIAYLASLRR